MCKKLAVLALLTVLLAMVVSTAYANTAGFFISGSHIKLQKDMFMSAKTVVLLPCVDKDGSPVIVDVIDPDCAPSRVPYGTQLVARLHGKIEGNFVRFYLPGHRKGFASHVKGDELPQLNRDDSLSPYYERFYPNGSLVRCGSLSDGVIGSSYVLGPNELSWWARGVKAVSSKTYGGPIQLWGHSKDCYQPVTFEFTAERLPENLSLNDPSPENVQAIRAWMYQGSSISGGYAASGSMSGLDATKVDAQLGQLWYKLNETIDTVNGMQDWIKNGEQAPQTTVTPNGQSSYVPENSGRGSYAFYVKTKNGSLYCGLIYLRICDRQGTHDYVYFLTPGYRDASVRNEAKRRHSAIQWFDDKGHIGFNNVRLGADCTYQYSMNGQVWSNPKDYNTSDGVVNLVLGGK